MALLAPLFVSSHAALRAKLRLTGLEAGSDAEAILDEAILAVRMKLIDRLSLSRVTSILGTTYTDTPVSNDEFLRTLAAVVEVKMVRLELIGSFPQAQMDAGGDIWKRWNEEAPFREISVKEMEAKRLLLLEEIEAALDLLAGEDEVGDGSGINTWDGAPDEETPAIGDSLHRELGTSLNLLNTEW